MSGAERALRIFLSISAVVLLAALPAVVMPIAWMASVHDLLGIGEFPDQPIVSYLARSASALYASFGCFYLFLLTDLRRYLPLLRFMACLKFVLASAIFCIDLGTGMPIWWTLAEGPLMWTWAGTLAWLAYRAERDARANSTRGSGEPNRNIEIKQV